MDSYRWPPDEPSEGDVRSWSGHQKADLVVSVLRGDVPLAQAARTAGLSQAEIREWRRRFLAAGEARLRGAIPVPDPVSPQRLRGENESLRAALREQRRQAEQWRSSAGFALGPFVELEAIRLEAALSVKSFSALIGISSRSYFRRLKLLRSGGPLDGRTRRAPSTQACVPIVAAYRIEWPEFGYRRLHAAMVADGHVTSPSTVLRAMRMLRGATGAAQRDDPAHDHGAGVNLRSVPAVQAQPQAGGPGPTHLTN